MTPEDTYRASACFGKIQFSTFTQAQRVGERSSRRGRSRQIYHCPHCHLFHLSDIMGVLKDGRTLAIEVKSPSHRHMTGANHHRGARHADRHADGHGNA